jgi:hypothetical protein
MPIYAEFASKRNRVNFSTINQAALRYLPDLAQAWCPDGKRCGSEWSACNPTRHDRHASLSINLTNGAWLDFATGDKGTDVVSLAAYLFHTSQAAAARTLAAVLGVR